VRYSFRDDAATLNVRQMVLLIVRRAHMYIPSPETYFRRFMDGVHRRWIQHVRLQTVLSLTRDIPLSSQRSFSSSGLKSLHVLSSTLHLHVKLREKSTVHTRYSLNLKGLQNLFKINTQPVLKNQNTITIPGATNTPILNFGLFWFGLFVVMYRSVEFQPTNQNAQRYYWRQWSMSPQRFTVMCKN